MCKQALAFLVVVSAVVQTSFARADGTITGLTLNLPAIKTCVAEKITVNGTGRCANLTLNFGDGHKIIVLSHVQGHPITFPATFTHRYAKLGTYTVQAESFQDQFNKCPGAASATVQVAAGPWITSMFTLGFFFSFDASPGALVILQGENFGDIPGQAWIHLKDWQGKPADYQLSDTQKYWGDTFVAGTIPSISGVLDQQATFTVVAQCGATSNAPAASFAAARDFVDLAYAAVPPDQWAPWYDCSMSSGVSDHDECQDRG